MQTGTVALIIFIVVLVVILGLGGWTTVVVHGNYNRTKSWDYVRSAYGNNSGKGVAADITCPPGQKVSVGTAMITPNISCSGIDVGSAGEYAQDVSAAIRSIANGKRSLTLSPTDIAKYKPKSGCPTVDLHVIYACEK